MKRRAMNIAAVLLALLMLLGLAFAEGNDEELQLGAPEGTEVLEIEDDGEDMDEVAAELVDFDLVPDADALIEQPAEEEPAEEQLAEEEAAEEEAAEEETTEEESAEEEAVEEEAVEEENAEEEAVEEETVEDEPPADRPVANALTYTGEAQALVAAEGAWLYSVDGETYSEDIPTAVDAGEYNVYFKAVEAADDAEETESVEAAEESEGAEAIIVTIAKADVTFTPPVAAYVED